MVQDLQIVNNLQPIASLSFGRRGYRRLMPTTRVAVLGSINMDLTTFTPRLPQPGETLLGTTFAASQGGKGANQALAAARSGADTTFLGAVGSDAFGQDLIDTLTEAGIDTSLVRHVDGSSGVASISVDGDGENTIVVVAGANSSLIALSDAERDAIAGADILMCQLEIPLETVVEGATHARDHGTLVLLNPSPAQDLPDELVEAVDVLVVNEAEARELAHVVSRVPHVVTTLGARGAHYRGPESASDFRSPTVDAIDTTGAGDAFTGALAAEWSAGPDDAIRWACAAGAFAATRRGAGSSSGTRTDIRGVGQE